MMGNMSDFAHIIVKRHLDRWSAWFEDSPDILSEDDLATDAIHGLMRLHGLKDLSTVRSVTVIGDTDEDQMEIRVPGDDG